MTDRLENALVRVRTAAGTLHGAGAFVGRARAGDDGHGYVLTCAHVVADALGEDRAARDAITYGAEAPTDPISVDFPVLAAGKLLRAEVVRESWRPAVDTRAVDDSDIPAARDIAVLRLLDAPPDQAEPIPATTQREIGEHFLAFGVPRGAERGTYARGDVLPRVGLGDIEIGVTDVSNADNFVERGYSGTPAWHVEHGAMFGMVAEVRGRSHAYVRPVESILEAWPELAPGGPVRPTEPPQPPPGSIRLPRKIPYDHLHSIDRTAQDAGLRRVLGALPSQQRHRPSIFLLPGAFEENAEELVPHFAHSILPPYGIKCGSGDIHDFPWVPWSDPATGSVDERIQELVTHLASTLGSPAPDEAAIRSALENPDNVNVVGWLVPTGSLDRPEAELIDRWFQFWNQVARDGLERRVAVFLCFVHYEDPPRGLDLMREFCDGRTWSQLPAIDTHPLPELEKIRADDVKVWCERVLPQAAGVRRRNLPRVSTDIKSAMPSERVTWTAFYETLDGLGLVAPEG